MRESIRANSFPIGPLPTAERLLSASDPIISRVIATETSRWPSVPVEDPIWGLVRIVMAQQVSTKMACRFAERTISANPSMEKPSPATVVDVQGLRAIGLSERRAQCCVNIILQSEKILAEVRQGISWEEALTGIKGIGPWTISVFRIMVLREPDEFPSNDLGLRRAIANLYGTSRDIERLSEKWRPFRSVACWYLWRTLGNDQLG